MKILVVGDERSMDALVGRTLRAEGFTVLTARSAIEALAYAGSESPDVVVLDITLPREEAPEAYGLLRAQVGVPLLMLTLGPRGVVTGARAVAEVQGSLSSPFHPRELVTHVRALVQHTEKRQDPLRSLSLGRLTLERERGTASVDGRRLPLRAKAFTLLWTFVQHRGKTLRREELLALVWGYAFPGQTRTVDVHVGHLRRALPGSGLAIETRRGVGYRLVEEHGLGQSEPLRLIAPTTSTPALRHQETR